jgi:hypothetical protein
MSMEKFDPTIGANKKNSEIAKQKRSADQKYRSEQKTYNPKTGEFDPVESLSFAEDGGHIALPKNKKITPMAKNTILPLNNMAEAGKENLAEEAEEFPEY